MPGRGVAAPYRLVAPPTSGPIGGATGLQSDAASIFPPHEVCEKVPLSNPRFNKGDGTRTVSASALKRPRPFPTFPSVQSGLTGQILRAMMMRVLLSHRAKIRTPGGFPVGGGEGLRHGSGCDGT